MIPAAKPCKETIDDVSESEFCKCCSDSEHPYCRIDDPCGYCGECLMLKQETKDSEFDADCIHGRR